jgi:uncharacterized membrane protein YeaQ/YmgE (transglycosylase-associated protein family)
MSNSKAGSMAASMAWAFAIGSVVVAIGLGYVLPGFIGWIVTALLFGAAGWAAVHMTQATTGKGIVAMLVAGLVAGVASFIIAKMMVSSAVSGAGGQAFNDAMKQASAQGGTQLTAEQQAQLANVGGAMAGGLGMMAGIVMFFGTLLKVFLCGMIGAFIGGATKKSAIGTSGAAAKAA